MSQVIVEDATSKLPGICYPPAYDQPLFYTPLPRSTFHDFVNKGKMLPVKGIRGF